MNKYLLTPEEITKLEVSCTYPDYSKGNKGYHVDWQEFTDKLLEAQLQKVINHPDILIKADDQSLPPIPYYQNVTEPNDIIAYTFQAMLADNWVKTIPKGAKDGR